jgi:hypothetical protein
MAQDLVVAQSLLGGIWTPSKGPDMLTWESQAVIGGPGCAYRGLVLPRGGPVQLIHLGMYHLFSPHGALELPTWWGRVLFTVRLGNTVRAPCLHTVVGGTPYSGYRQPWSTRSKAMEAQDGRIMMSFDSC